MYKQFLKQFYLETGPRDTHTHTQISQKEMDLEVFIAPSALEGRRAEGRERAGYLATFARLDVRTFPENQSLKNGPEQPNPEEARRGDLP